jgi:hypothetical protein
MWPRDEYFLFVYLFVTLPELTKPIVVLVMLEQTVQREMEKHIFVQQVMKTHHAEKCESRFHC